MVRINIIDPKMLADQHLMAEHLEIFMLLDYARRYPEQKEIPENYTLGKGHIKFFKNKLKYLQKRHEQIREEIKRRGYKSKKQVDLTGMQKELINDWKPKEQDYEIIKERIRKKIKQKPNFYRYFGNKKPLSFFEKLIIKK